ncbi:MAG: hypothetical protein J6C97_01985 [Clostridia bacterium]|nr:hypothetical protein [Clostridia bacterium]
MKSFKKVFTLALAILFSLIIFVGCSNNGNTNSSSLNVPTLSQPSVSNPNSTSSSDSGNQEGTVLFERNLVVSAPANDIIIAYAFEDEDYNYYMIDLGYVKNALVSSGNVFEYNSNYVGQTISLDSTITSEESISKGLTETVSKTVSKTEMNSVEVGVGIKKNAKIGEVSAHLNYTRTWGTVTDNQNSVASSTETTESFGNSLGNSYSYSFKAGDKAGYYRYAIYGVADIYLVLTTTKDNQTIISAENFASVRNNLSSPLFVKFEYSESLEGFMGEDSYTKLGLPSNFDLSMLPLPSVAISTMSIPVNRHMCAADNKYDPNTNGVEKDGAKHDGYELGDMLVYGCIKNGDTFIVSNVNDFLIEYKITQDLTRLPNPTNNEFYIVDDSETSVANTDIQNQRVGKGAYQLTVINKNGSTAKTEIATNFMDGKTVGSVVQMLNANGLDVDQIRTIKITIVYELNFYASIFDQHHQNWRCEYVINF